MRDYSSGIAEPNRKEKTGMDRQRQSGPLRRRVPCARGITKRTTNVQPFFICVRRYPCCFFILSRHARSRFFRFPAPVAMLLLAVLIKLFRLVPASIENGAFGVSRFFSTAVTYPLLFAIGVSMTPWDKLVAAFNLSNIITILSVVVTMMAVGFFTGKWLNMYPIETAIINACHSGQGGTGDVAILSAAERLELMPFAQVSTRIGGAITVSLTLLLLHQFY